LLARVPCASVRGVSKDDRLWDRYWGIREHGRGLAVPILWHLVLRGDLTAMTELSSTFARSGRAAERHSQAGLAYRAYRGGLATGAQHLAMDAFNRRDMSGYRRWLARAAKAGDQEAGRELRRFEQRLPHRNAARIGRKRPERRADSA
jgi:hypothetical protein